MKAQARAAEVEKRGTRGPPVNILDYEEKGVFLSVQQFCRETGKARETVQSRLRLDIIKPMRTPKGIAVYRLRDLIDLVFHRDDAGHVDIDRLDPFRRKAHYSAELDKLRMLKESGTLIPAPMVEGEQARIAKIVAQFLDTLPDVLERDCGLNAQSLAVIERRIDTARVDLHKAIHGGPEDDGAGKAAASDSGAKPARKRAAGQNGGKSALVTADDSDAAAGASENAPAKAKRGRPRGSKTRTKR